MAKAAGGAALRGLQTLIYFLLFCHAAVILGIFSYFLAVLADRDLAISNKWKAVEAMSGAAVLYLILAILLTWFLGGINFLASLAILLNLLFCGAFIAIAVLTRDGARRCSGNVNTPLGIGNAATNAGFGPGGFGAGQDENITHAANLGRACRLNKAVFILAIIAAVVFLIAAIVQALLARHHKKEKRFGPSPANNYTSGTGKQRFWQRKPMTAVDSTRDTEMTAGTGSLGVPAPAVRPSHDTAYTGSTVAPTGGYESMPKTTPPHHPNALAPGHTTGHHTGHTAGHTTGHSHVTPNIPPAVDHGGIHVPPTTDGINHNHPYALDAPRVAHSY